MFERLVENGIDFLNKAVSELKEDQYKYSVIHFYAAVEIFLKARLMHEHWSLVISKNQEPDWDKFNQGDFQSVTLDEAASRLLKIVRSGLSKEELLSFKDVGKHRNKMVHFFHDVGKEKNNERKSQIAGQQLKAWCLLHQIVNHKWKDVFLKWNHEITAIDNTLKELRPYLQVKFETLMAEIEKREKEGFVFEECPSCGFKSIEYCNELDVLYKAKCLVCDYVAETCMNLQCPDCGRVVTLRNEGYAKCECKKEFAPDDVESALIDVVAAHTAAKEGENLRGNCSLCDGYNRVVQMKNGKWICTNCFEEFDSLETCNWCGELNTGNMEDSYLFGCNFCEGSARHLREE